MTLLFSELQQIVRERNEMTISALECAVLALSRARELPPHQQKPMLAFLTKLISLGQDHEDLTESVGLDAQDDSAETLIISHGDLTGGADYTRKMAEKHGKPWIHVDASEFSVDAAVAVLRGWVNGSRIMVLNVAGPRASKDARIYSTTKAILKGLFQSTDEDR